MNPNACRECGIDKRGHGRQYTEAAGWHAWTPPIQEQIKARMLARRAARGQDVTNLDPGDRVDPDFPPACHDLPMLPTDHAWRCQVCDAQAHVDSTNRITQFTDYPTEQ